MKFVDQVRVFVRAGKGGSGAVAWRREAFVPRGGPAGGDGGDGGDVVFVADSHFHTLLDLQYRQHLRAEPGKNGASKQRYGRGGEDLIVKVPVGTMVYVDGPGEEAATAAGVDPEDLPDDAMETIYVVDESDDDVPWMTAPFDPGDPETAAEGEIPEVGTLLGDLTEEGQTLVVAQGGRGGRGNMHFKTPTNRTPTYAEPGRLGQSLRVRLELKLLADVGIVGYPNVGKSTLISKISRARPKVADYPFTTLAPQLGVVKLSDQRSMVVADVPGLIDGASEGKGLGHQFLRHLERTRVLLHLLALDPDPQREPVGDLDAIEAELAKYGEFDKQPRIVALNKSDTLMDKNGKALIADLRAELKARNIPLFVISAHTGKGVDKLLEAIWRRISL
jgi:GTP-binding protein